MVENPGHFPCADGFSPLFAQASDASPQWRDVIPRLVEVDLLPDDEALIARILAAGEDG